MRIAIMQSVGMWGSSLYNVYFLHSNFLKNFDAFFVSTGKFTSLVTAPVKKEDEPTTSLECVFTLTIQAPMLDPTGVHDTPNYFWTEDQNIYGLFV